MLQHGVTLNVYVGLQSELCAIGMNMLPLADIPPEHVYLRSPPQLCLWLVVIALTYSAAVPMFACK